jgi:hypothetical protein
LETSILEGLIVGSFNIIAGGALKLPVGAFKNDIALF